MPWCGPHAMAASLHERVGFVTFRPAIARPQRRLESTTCARHSAVVPLNKQWLGGGNTRARWVPGSQDPRSQTRTSRNTRHTRMSIDVESSEIPNERPEEWDVHRTIISESLNMERPEIVVDRPEPWLSLPRIFLEQPLVPFVAVVVGVRAFDPLVIWTASLVAQAGRRIDTVVTGIFLPSLGLLFAMLATTAIGTLRQRQQECRDVINQELASIRLLSCMLTDRYLLHLLLEYTCILDAETFSHRANKIFYRTVHDQDTRDGERREYIFTYAEELLMACLARTNTLRLRPDIERTVYDLVSLRTRRRALLESGFPQAHFTILCILGASILWSFLLLLAGEPSWFPLISVRAMYAILLALAGQLFVLIADLRDPFRGRYRLSSARFRRTLSLLRLSVRALDDTDIAKERMVWRGSPRVRLRGRGQAAQGRGPTASERR